MPLIPKPYTETLILSVTIFIKVRGILKGIIKVLWGCRVTPSLQDSCSFKNKK